MKKDDVKLYRDLQKNAEAGLSMLSNLQERMGKLELEKVALEKQAQYSECKNKVQQVLVNEKEELYQNSKFGNIGQMAAVEIRLMMDTSESRLAEILLEEENRELSNLYRAIHKNKNASEQAMNCAKEFIDAEEKFIQKLRQFL